MERRGRRVGGGDSAARGWDDWGHTGVTSVATDTAAPGLPVEGNIRFKAVPGHAARFAAERADRADAITTSSRDNRHGLP